MSAADRVARLLTLVPWLADRGPTPLDEVADAAGSDRDTVLEDLRMLEFCGLPGLAGGDLFELELQGDRVALRIAPALGEPFRPGPTEALRLVLALDAVAAALGDELPGLRDAVAALRGIAGVPAGVVVEPDGPARHVAALRRAVTDGTTVVLDYRGRSDETSQQRRVEPWEVGLHRGRWYLDGHDVGADGHRTFRLDRVGAVEVTSRPAVAPRPVEPPAAPAFVPGDDAVEVQLRLAPGGGWLLRQLDGVEMVSEADDGTRVVRATTDAPGWLAGLVVGGAGEVVVEAPEELRQEVVRRATRALAGQGLVRAGHSVDVPDVALKRP